MAALTVVLPTQLRTPPTGAPRASARPAARGGRAVLKVVADESMTDAYARIRESRARAKAEREGKPYTGPAGTPKGKGRKGLSVLGALDFQEDIEADQSLLAKARALRKGEKMSRESYQAVERKVKGTKAGFFGEQVELKSKYEQLGYIKGDGTSDSKVGSLIGAGVALAGVVATLVALAGL